MEGLLDELGAPRGESLQTREGGERTLRSILDDFRRYDFTGSVIVSQERDGERSQGIVGFDRGRGIVAAYVYHRRGMSGAGRVYMGDKAVSFIWEDATFGRTVFEIVGHADVSDLAAFFPEGGIAGASLIRPSWLPRGPRPYGALGDGDRVSRSIDVWTRDGYDLTSLYQMMLRDGGQATRALPFYERAVARAGAVRATLSAADTTGYEREARSLLLKTRYPDHIGEVESEVDLMIDALGPTGRGKEDEIHDRVSRDRHQAKEDEVWGILTRLTSERPAETSEDLDPSLTFERFIEGPGNQFAKAASLAVSNHLGRSYNPLFIYSRSGMGKTHLMQSIGNHVRGLRPGARISYLPADRLEAELLEALSSNTLSAFRERLDDVDLLLIDDVQFLAGRERAQEELIRVFNEVMSHGGQAVLASDLLPREIPSLSNRLITRFESGLIIDIQPPDIATRIAILRHRRNSVAVDVPDDVLQFIAELCHGSVRELNGGLNRLMAFSTLMSRAIDMDLAEEVLAFKVQTRSEAAPRMMLSRGHSYLFEEWKPEVSYRVMSDKLSEGLPGLAISRSNPRFVRERLGDDATLMWLTDQEDCEGTIGPSLERIILMIEDFLDENEGAVVLLDDVHYLLSNVSFDGFIRFVRRVVDQVSNHESIFLMSADPGGLDDRERSVLEREMEVLRPPGGVRAV